MSISVRLGEDVFEVVSTAPRYSIKGTISWVEDAKGLSISISDMITYRISLLRELLLLHALYSLCCTCCMKSHPTLSDDCKGHRPLITFRSSDACHSWKELKYHSGA